MKFCGCVLNGLTFSVFYKHLYYVDKFIICYMYKKAALVTVKHYNLTRGFLIKCQSILYYSNIYLIPLYFSNAPFVLDTSFAMTTNRFTFCLKSFNLGEIDFLLYTFKNRTLFKAFIFNISFLWP